MDGKSLNFGAVGALSGMLTIYKANYWFKCKDQFWGEFCYCFEGGHIVSSAALKKGEAFLLPEVLVLC